MAPITRPASPLPGAAGMRLHDHACQLDARTSDAVDAAAAFLCAALAADRDAWFVDGTEGLGDAVRRALAARGVPVDEAERRGELAILGHGAFQTRHPAFDPDRLLDDLHAAVAASRARGRGGIHVVADLTWTFAGHPGTERVLEFESRLADFFPTQELAAICQYRRPRFPAATLRDALRAHPLVLRGGVLRPNPHFVPPAELLGTADPEAELERLLASLELPGANPGALVSICAWCKAVREDQRWTPIETWAAQRTQASFTHALCPDCYVRLTPRR